VRRFRARATRPTRPRAGNEGFVKGFTASELVFTPAVLGLAAVLARVQGKD